MEKRSTFGHPDPIKGGRVVGRLGRGLAPPRGCAPAGRTTGGWTWIGKDEVEIEARFIEALQVKIKSEIQILIFPNNIAQRPQIYNIVIEETLGFGEAESLVEEQVIYRVTFLIKKKLVN